MGTSLWIILLKFLGVLVLIGLNAFFVAIEFAVVAARRTRVDQLVRQGSARARIVQRWVRSQQNKDSLIAAAQLGITIASLALGYLGEETFQSIVEAMLHQVVVPESLSGVIRALPLVISLTVVTSLHVILGEQVPKVASLRAPEQVASAAAPWMSVFERVFHPFVWLLDRASAGVLRLFGMAPVGGHSTIYTVDELRQIVRESEDSGVLEEQEEQMLLAVFDLRALKASQVMVPRTEMVCVPVDATLDGLAELAAQTSLTKFPVFDGDLDHVVGVVHVKDMIRAMMKHQGEPISLDAFMREATFLPESIPVPGLLAAFRRQRQHIAILLDEYGGTAGLVTLEDLLEEIVGEVQDIFDDSKPSVRWTTDGSALVDGMMQIEEFNSEFNLALSDANYTTIGGVIMGLLDRVPEKGDEVELEGGKVRLRVAEMDQLRVATLRILLEDAPPEVGKPRSSGDGQDDARNSS